MSESQAYAAVADAGWKAAVGGLIPDPCCPGGWVGHTMGLAADPVTVHPVAPTVAEVTIRRRVEGYSSVRRGIYA